MSLISKIDASLHNIGFEIDRLLRDREQYEQKLSKLQNENADLNHRIKLITSEMENYLEELRKIREHYVSNNDRA